jgi:NTP pyrophosphatase (non-canonical NTP hydrolase)
MEFDQVKKRALEVRKRFEEFETREYGRSWTREEIALGFVGDVGDLAKLVLAREGVRTISDREEKLEHELSDCLWSVLVLAHLHDIDLEKAFMGTMDFLEEKLAEWGKE